MTASRSIQESDASKVENLYDTNFLCVPSLEVMVVAVRKQLVMKTCFHPGTNKGEALLDYKSLILLAVGPNSLKTSFQQNQQERSSAHPNHDRYGSCYDCQ